MGASVKRVKAKLRGARWRKLKLKGRKNKGREAYEEKVVFERHTPAKVLYRFVGGRLYEVELRYLRKGRVGRMASLLRKKFSRCKKRGKKVTCASGGRRISLRPAGGKVVVYFTSPKIVASAKKPAPEPEPEAEERAEVAAPTKPAPEPTPAAPAVPAPEPEVKVAVAPPPKPPKPKKVRGNGRLYAERAADPSLWDALGVKSGKVTLFPLKLAAPKRRRRAATHYVAAGFRRDADEPLAAILGKGDGWRVRHLGLGCAGTPVFAKTIDFRLDGDKDAAIWFGAGDDGPSRVALVPFDQRFAGAKFIGGRFGGRNVFRCYRLGGEVLRLDLRDVDHDHSIDLLLTYRHEGAGVVHDVYFFQGNDFYFRETRPGAPRDER